MYGWTVCQCATNTNCTNTVLALATTQAFDQHNTEPQQCQTTDPDTDFDFDRRLAGDLDFDFDFDRPLAGDLERDADLAPPALRLLLRERAAAAAAACGGERDLLALRAPAGLRLRLALRCLPFAAAAAGLRGLRLRPRAGLRLREPSLQGTDTKQAPQLDI
jgi:hypothetical protein